MYEVIGERIRLPMSKSAHSYIKENLHTTSAQRPKSRMSVGSFWPDWGENATRFHLIIHPIEGLITVRMTNDSMVSD